MGSDRGIDHTNFLISRTTPLTPHERKVVEDNLGLIGSTIKQRFRIPGPRADDGVTIVGDRVINYRDLFEAGVFGLIEAASRWNPERGAFSTCAEMWITNKIRRFIRSYADTIHIPKWSLHAKVEEHGEAKVAREQRRIQKARGLLGVNDALDAASPNPGEAQRRVRQRILGLAYLTIRDPDDSIRTGRIVALKLGGLDGDTAGVDDDERFGEIARGLGLTKKRARADYLAFLAAARERLRDLTEEP